MEIQKKIHINIPLIEAIQQRPNYSKFMKDVLKKRKRVREFSTIALTQECSQHIQGKCPPKLKDLRSFIVPCNMRDSFFGRSLYDLGASINLMPLSIFKKLGTGVTIPTTIILQLADRSICYLQWKIGYVLARVDKFLFSTDFIIMDFSDDEETLILLG
ncbi:uncharacterized protein LOC131628485 [Vicia villosa]|uniref:uncharacterized protein LOC131628485 n=1 Tax=Vicia villosa TaxID=3911 RepID=UPI00273C2054|nr:uncharacterized protein LOC131628485 [Vicia villosa]